MSTKTKIKILQRGGVKNHDVLEKATRWGLSQLMSNRMANTLSIRLELRATTLDKNFAGTCAIKSANGSRTKKEFTVVMQRDVPLPTQLSILFHELTHVGQYASNRLQQRWWKSDSSLHFRWEGTDMGTTQQNDYWTRPWEVEARRAQDTLLAAWNTLHRETS